MTIIVIIVLVSVRCNYGWCSNGISCSLYTFRQHHYQNNVNRTFNWKYRLKSLSPKRRKNNNATGTQMNASNAAPPSNMWFGCLSLLNALYAKAVFIQWIGLIKKSFDCEWSENTHSIFTVFLRIKQSQSRKETSTENKTAQQQRKKNVYSRLLSFFFILWQRRKTDFNFVLKMTTMRH